MSPSALRRLLAASLFAVIASTPHAALMQQQKGGEEETGPYDIVENWPQPWSKAGYIWGSQPGVFAESPNRIFIASRGEIKLPAPGAVDGPAVAFVRPHDLVRAPAGEESFFITTDRINLQGPVVRIEGRTPGGLRIEAAFERNSAEGLRSGDKLGLTAQKAYVFNA